MRWTALALAACALAAASPARAASRDDAERVRDGLERAVEAGRLSPDLARRYGAELDRAERLARRSASFARVLSLVASHAPRFDEPRTRVLFSTLAVNATRLGSGQRDVEDAEGVVYRRFGSYGYQFHPLANFARLNGRVASGRLDAAARLGSALLERAVPAPGAGLVWEYLFPYGGAAPWVSGMAQAVAAQSLARVGQGLGEPVFADAARGAFAAIPGRLTHPLPEGPWVRLYSFNRLAVLNAQLQTVLSLGDYAALSGDAAAAALGNRMAVAAAAALPRFDTGAWSLYALGGREAQVGYHDYVVSLLKRLAAKRPEEPVWSEAATRFELYLVEPPAVSVSWYSPVAYPWPREGFHDDVGVRFSLSKRSQVTLQVGPHGVTTTLGRGTHLLAWNPVRAVPGTYYRVRLTAVDLAGNRSEVALGPVEVRKDTTPPDVLAEVLGPRLVWQAVDEGTPWISLELRLERGGTERRTVRLGRRPLEGSLRLRLPPGRWNALLVVSDSAGNVSRASLGPLGP